MQIIHGKYKYQKINMKKNSKCTPVSTMVRANIFNLIENYVNWNELTVCDLFAGSGVLGIEALSRGSGFCYFNDLDSQNCLSIRENIEKIQIDNVKITSNSYEQCLAKIKNENKKLDLVFVDPPYQQKNMPIKTLKLLLKNQILNNNAIIVVKTNQKQLEKIENSLELIKVKKYGKNYIYLYQFNQQNKTAKIEIKENKLIIISGPSGVGKKTIINKLLKEPSLNLAYSISVTTRKPRKKEKDGSDYYFVTKTEFEQEIKNNNFIEYAKYIDNYYGTSKTYIERLINQGKNIIFEIEIIGALKIKKQFKQAIWIFILSPSFEELQNRIEKRNTEKPAEIKKRIRKAKKEIRFVREENLCDYYVVNDKIDETATEIIKILKKVNK